MRRRYFVPEVIQTSAMDCGPAALKALLEGHGIRASYGRLRESCQTSVDGTSIDALEVAAQDLGLEAEQIMVPVDHLLSREEPVLPALLVVRQPGGLTHFVVVWRRHGDWLQVMDPAVGRRWMRASALLDEVYRHAQAVPREAWLEWARGDGFLKPLRARMRACGVSDPPAADDYESLSRLDAATRMVASLRAAGGLDAGSAPKLLQKLAAGDQNIPDAYWSAAKLPDPEMMEMRGAVLIAVRGVKERSASSTELVAALDEKPQRPILSFLRQIFAGVVFTPMAVTIALAAASAGVLIEALLFRGLFDIGRELTVAGQRMAAIGALLALSAILLALEFSVSRAVLGLGRRIEAAFRLRFLLKLPRLNDRYFQSRPISDMAQRSHQVQVLRTAPVVASSFLHAAFDIATTTAGIVWLYPEDAMAALLLAAACAGIPLAAQSSLAERDLRLKSHGGALTQFYLDALMGLTAIRVHGAEGALRRAQAALLESWANAGFALARLVVAVEGMQLTAAFGIAAWIVWNRLQPGAEPAGLLLLVYWVLQLPSLGQELAAAAWQYPAQRNTTLRLLEPLGAPEEPVAEAAEAVSRTAGMAITLENVTVRAGGHVILDDVTLSIAAGEHVAIVGASGAGKSSLAGVLLGWHRATGGAVLVDGEPLDAAALRRVRTETAWVDPQVQLWNRTLLDNLRYGGAGAAMDGVVEDANLGPLLEKLPDGFQTVLGEGGALVSGGEGQRVRMGRGLGRSSARLAILDEPARGLDGARRHAVVSAARRRWHDATLLAITHDIGETANFGRVLVIDAGRVAEDGSPSELAAREDSIYRRLLEAERDLKASLWTDPKWRRLRMDNGRLTERSGDAAL